MRRCRPATLGAQTGYKLLGGACALVVVATLSWLAYGPARPTETAAGGNSGASPVTSSTAHGASDIRAASIESGAARTTHTTMAVPNAAPGSDTDTKRVVALEAAIVQLGNRLTELETRLYSQDELLRDIAVLASGHGANEPGSQRRVRDIAHDEVERSQQMRLAVVDSAFEAEMIDASWSRKAVDQVREALDRGLDPSLEILELDCRSTLCRIEIAHAESYGHSKWQVALIGSPTARFEDLWSIEGSNTDESKLSIVYAARRGHTLPGS